MGWFWCTRLPILASATSGTEHGSEHLGGKADLFGQMKSENSFPSTCKLFMLCVAASLIHSHMSYMRVGVINWLKLFHCIFVCFSSSLPLILSSCLFSFIPEALLYIWTLNHNMWHRKHGCFLGAKKASCRWIASSENVTLCTVWGAHSRSGRLGFMVIYGWNWQAAYLHSIFSFWFAFTLFFTQNVPCIKHGFGESGCEQLEV